MGNMISYYTKSALRAMLIMLRLVHQRTFHALIGLTLSLVSILLFGSCKDDDEIINTEDIKAKLAAYPRTDCSTSTSPLRDIMACHWFGMRYKWVELWGTNAIDIDLPKYFPDHDDHVSFTQKNVFWGTNQAYENLINNSADVIIASRDISRNEKTLSEEKDVEILTKPLAIDGLIFIVNKHNPVSNLTADQIRKIYTGEITNWKEVGGPDHKITPYQRDVDSGSQEKMETLVMNGQQMMDCPNALVLWTMYSPYESLNSDEYGICYSPYFYRNAMVAKNAQQKMLSIDGIEANKKTLANGSYPFTSNIYAAIRARDYTASSLLSSVSGVASQYFDFLFSAEGDKAVIESGYVPLK